MTKIECVILDWAGTTVDYGCFAPVGAFLRMFRQFHLDVTTAQIRRSMGLAKIDHIRTIMNDADMTKQFLTNYSRQWFESDIVKMNEYFEQYLFETLREFARPLPYVLETAERLRGRGIKIGSTTGYTEAMMQIVCVEAAAQGYHVDHLETPDTFSGGRPSPFMIFRNMERLKIDSVKKIVKVGDTIADIREGYHAGCFSIGIIEGSSELGLSLEEFIQTTPDKIEIKKRNIAKRMFDAGADYVLNNISELPDCIEKIEQKITGKTAPYLLLTPGPLSTTQTVKEVMLQDWCTWDTDYNEGVVTVIRDKLLKLASETPNNLTTVLLQGSGTYVVEAVLNSTVRNSDHLLIVTNGVYGDRMIKIADKAALPYTVLRGKIEQPISSESIREKLQTDSSITHVAFVHCETTTGILNPLEQISETVKSFDKLLVVDAMSSFGGIPIDVEKLNIDFLISSANKCIQGVPGFAFIIAKTEKMKQIKGIARTLSLDIYDQWETMNQGKGKWRFTSPTHVVRAFAQALLELEQEGGIAARYKRYVENERRLYEGMKKIGYTPFLPQDFQSPIITSFLYPKENFSFEDFYYRLKANGVVIYPGKISDIETFRIGTIGEVYPEDISFLLELIQSLSGN
ncbi:MAG: 2-aminoethylphosphonate--pyruvate transaminase [Planctomycetaceae bacterium]|jgi:2-aminoethylphosphonate--pyruvate transaminase/phosphonoacetaldehyde hydrolase|nr:2-aminoethylphosphonate--pyruvate transaminase [Planctomycetaceae bacterium]